MAIPFSEVRPASLKMRVLPRYPASYVAGAGIAIEQEAGVVTTSVDFSNLERDDITDPTTLYVGAWDSEEEIFKLVLGSNLKGEHGDPGPAGGYLSDEELTATDLNTVLTTGEYYVAASCTNQPSGTTSGAGYLQVFATPSNPNYVAQVFITDNNDPTQMWARSRRAGAWDSWQRVGSSGVFDAVSIASAATIPAVQTNVRTLGYYAAGDGGGALYKRVVSLASGVAGFQSADGAWWQLAETVVNVLMTGAVGDGATDDSTEIQLAVTSAYALGGIVELPNRPFHITSAINIIHAVTIRGMGQNANSNIYPATTVSAFTINTTEPVELRDFSIAYPSAASSGTAGISITAPTSYNARSRIINVYIGFAYNAITTGAAALWVIDKCYMQNIVNDGIQVQNTWQVDAGDSVIEHCVINCGVAAIHYVSSSGLRVINNKINGATYGLLMEWNGTQALDSTNNNPGADLWVSNNSIEGIASGGSSIILSRADASSSFGTVIVSDNELSGNRGLFVSAASNFLINLVATGNIMLGETTAASTAFLLQYVRGYMIANNYMQSQFANSILVNIDATNSDGVVGPTAKFGSFAASTTSGTSSTTISPT